MIFRVPARISYRTALNCHAYWLLPNTNYPCPLNIINDEHQPESFNCYHDFRRRPFTPSSRRFHATPRHEILPLLAVVALGVAGRYSFRAMKRMEREWEEYEEALKEYRTAHGVDTTSEGDGVTSDMSHGQPHKATGKLNLQYKEGIMAIVLGTVNIRVSYASSSSEPKIIVDREGGRTTPNNIYFDQNGNFVLGRLALDKLYERARSNYPVLNPFDLLMDNNKTLRQVAVREVVVSAAQNALETVLGYRHINGYQNYNALFTSDFTSNSGRNVKPVFTYPPQPSKCTTSDEGTEYTIKYKDAIKNMVYPESFATFVSEPIAAVIAAKYYGLLSRFDTANEEPILVIDVGGNETYLSIVRWNSNAWLVEHSLRIKNFGGETLVEALMDYASRDFFGKNYKDVNDGLGVQKIYNASRSAVQELSRISRVQMNIPFLSVDNKLQPRHLDMGISRKILEAEFVSIVSGRITQSAKHQQILSTTLPDPKDHSSFFASVIMRILENSQQNPFALSCVLAIGGGTRSPLIQNGVKGGLAIVAGDQFVESKTVIPEDELAEELVALGAVLTQLE